jgi:hypothetical protein
VPLHLSEGSRNALLANCFWGLQGTNAKTQFVVLDLVPVASKKHLANKTLRGASGPFLNRRYFIHIFRYTKKNEDQHAGGSVLPFMNDKYSQYKLIGDEFGT